MPTISVIVPVYKAEAFLCHCVDSICAQSFTDFELILVDDGSPDNCPAICDSYADNDCRIHVIHQTNQGQAAARNRAITMSQGEWLCFIDSDDMVHPQLLELLYHSVIDVNANLSMCSVVEGTQVTDDFLTTVNKSVVDPIEMNEENLLHIYEQGEHRGWIACAKLIRKSIVLRNLFAAGRIYEDNAVVCRWLVDAGIVADIQDELYFYRVNSQGTTKSAFNIKKLNYLWALSEMIAFFDSIDYRILKKRFCSMYMQASPGYYWRSLNELSSAESARNVKKQMWQIMRKNYRYICLSKSQRFAVYEIFYPHVVKLYRLFRATVRTIRERGINGLLKKIHDHIFGGAL